MRASRDEIPALVIPDSGQSFKGDDFRMLCKPCVYMFMQDGVPIYIGMSRRGLQRITLKVHREAGRAREECDEVRIFPCVNAKKAFKLEAIMIGTCQPKYNKRKKYYQIAKQLGLQRVSFTYPQVREVYRTS